MNPTFKTGDLVVLKSSPSPQMTVDADSRTNSDKFFCYYFKDNDLVEVCLHPGVLKIYETANYGR
jgi:hypothetical protein